MTKIRIGAGVMASIALAASIAAAPVFAETAIKIESWRSEDSAVWNDVIIPAFEASNPGINVEYTPTAPEEYNASLNARLAAGTAGDIISCRSFDAALELYNQGYLTSVKDLDAIGSFPAGKLVAWQTDDGSDTFCLPLIGTMHGFIYNLDIFNELGLEEPVTEDEFFAVLDAIKEDGQYVPLAIGSKDAWALGTMGFLNIGVQYWKGEEGRLGLIDGSQKLTDQAYVDAMTTLGRWGDYMSRGFEAISYSDAQTMFTLGRAAIYPAGSWEIPGFRNDADFDMGIFRVPVKTAGDTCYVTDHTDMGIGGNPVSEHPEEVKAFLEWVGSREFSELLGNGLPGLFPLSNYDLNLDDPLATEFLTWRQECESSIRMPYQILSRGIPNLDAEIARVSVAVVNGDMSPEDAMAEVQAGLDSWFDPAK